MDTGDQLRPCASDTLVRQYLTDAPLPSVSDPHCVLPDLCLLCGGKPFCGWHNRILFRYNGPWSGHAPPHPMDRPSERTL